MEKRRHSFASRLSFKTVLITSLIFMAAIAVIIFQGGPVMYDRSVKYSRECLKTSTLDVQSNLAAMETAGNTVVNTFEEHYNSNLVIDTASCYRLLRELLRDNSGMIGCGFFFEPYKYIKKNRFAGIYVTSAMSPAPGLFSQEWDDDESFRKDGYDYSTTEWYSSARESGTPIWVSPFLEYVVTTEYQTLMTTYSCPVKDRDGNFIGVFAIDMSLDWLYDKLIEIRPYEHSNVAIADSELNFICNPLSQKPYEGTMYDTPFIPGMEYTLDRNLSVGDLSSFGKNAGELQVRQGKDVASLIFQEMENGWILCTASLFSDIFAELSHLLMIVVIITVACLILLFFLSRRVIHKVSEPVKDFAVAAGKITDGRFDVPIPVVKTSDELEDLGNALSFMQESVTNYISALKTTTAAKERLESELKVARDIQSKMLTTDFPTMSSAGIYATAIPAREVGGDLYDFLVDGNRIYFIVGDVSGKGVPAALLMAIAISAFRAIDKRKHTVSEITALINNTFCRSNKEMMFVTMIVGCLDTETGVLKICNGGHNPMMTISPDGTSCLYQACHRNLVCGIMEDFPYQEEELILERGSRLIVYTDGVTEAERADMVQYEESRLLEWGRTCGKDISDAEAVASLVSSVNSFTQGNEPNDDRTVLSISLE